MSDAARRAARPAPPPETDWMAGKVGAFVHYWPSIAGRPSTRFDTEQFRRDILAMGVDFFFLTLGQNAGTYIAPNETYERITGRRRGEATAACHGRDIPREMIEALRGTGVKFCLYLPCKGPARDPEASRRLGFAVSEDGKDPVDTPEGLANWCEVVGEWSERYGRDVHAWWFDGGPGPMVDRGTLALRAAARRGNPDAVCAFAKKVVDYDHGFRWVLGMDRREGRELDTLFTEYGCRGEARHEVWAGCDFTAGEATNPMRIPCDGREVLGRQWFALTYLGGMWGWTDCRHTDDVWADWLRRVLPLGACACFDIGFVHDAGTMSPAQVAQLRRVVALARGTPDAETAARHEREMRVIDALRDVEHAYGRGCEHPIVPEGRETAQAEIEASLAEHGAVFVNEGERPVVLRGAIELKPGQVFLADQGAKFAAAPGERAVVRLADGVMFEGGTWENVDFDLAGRRHFVFRRAWLGDGCAVRADGASECEIEYLEGGPPTPRQRFEIRPASKPPACPAPRGVVKSASIDGHEPDQDTPLVPTFPMDLIPSFQVDHTKIVPGIYESRADEIGGGFATTFDIRMKTPNKEPAIHPNAMHTIEHVVATFLRNDPEWRDRIVYWGPMGCLTGCYLIVKGRPKPQELQPLLLRAFEHLRDYEGEVPGATPLNCGNYLLHDLPMAKWEAARYVEVLAERPCYDYPVAERLVTKDGAFYDA